MDINFDIVHDSTNISDHVISYQRSQQICSGIGTLDVIIENENLGRTILPWDEFVLYEQGNKIGTYIVSTSKRSADGGTLNIQCQDYSKKLVDNFVTDNFSVSYLSTTRYWIEYFLSASDVDYEFSVTDDGEIVASNSSFGMSSAYDMIMTFLQQSGWYIYFDKNGKAIVGTLERAGDYYDDNINDNDIISLQRTRNDNRLRNRAVVWGMGDPVTGSWITADISVNTPWNIDSDDLRTIVLSNSMIYSTVTAEDLAKKMLNEFARIANEITVEVINHYDIELGDMVYINSDDFSGKLRVTSIESTGSSDGLVVKLILNQMCPRLFAYFGTMGDFIPVYIGTWGEGVWHKYTGGSVWTPMNSGLVGDALCIKDLFVKTGSLACVTNDGYMYTSNITTSGWSKFYHGDLIDLNVNLYLEPDIKAVCCSIDDMGNIIAGYQYDNGEIKRSWVLTVSGTGVLLRAEQIIPQTGEDYTEEIRLIDLEAIGYPEEGIIESVEAEGIPISSSMMGEKKFQAYNSIDPNCFGVGPPVSFAHPGGYISGGGSNFCAGYIIENDDTFWNLIYSGGKHRLLQYNLSTQTLINSYVINPPTTGRISVSGSKQLNFLYKRTPVVFDIISLEAIWNESYTYVIGHNLYHYSYTLGNPDFTLVNSETMMGFNDRLTFQKAELQNHIVTYFFTGVRNTQTSLITGYLYSYNLLDHVLAAAPIGEILRGETSSSGVYTSKFTTAVQPFFVSNGSSIFAGFLYFIMWRQFPYYTRTQLYCSYNAVSSFGSYYITPQTHAIRTYEMTGIGNVIPGVEFGLVENPFYSGYTGGEIYPEFNNGASTVLTANIFIEYTIHYRHRYSPELNNVDCESIIISFPGAMSIATSSVNFSESSGGYGSETGVHLAYNTVLDKLTRADCHISGRVFGPYLVRVLRNLETDAYLINLLDMTNLSSSLIDFTELGFSIDTGLDYPKTTPGFYRDDYDGSIYMTIKPQPGGTGDWALYGLNSNGTLRKKITNWDVPSDIVKTYAISREKIKWFTPPYSLEKSSLILKHTSAPFEAGLIGASLDAQEQTYGIFEIILEPPLKTKVEISKGVPTVIYSSPLISGIENIDSFMAASISNLPNDFYYPPPNENIFIDARVVDIPEGFTIASGVLPLGLLERYVAATTSGEVLLIKYDFSGSFYPLVTLSGLMILTSGMIPPADPNSSISLLETTNYTPEPFFFIATSGITPLFFQRTSISGYSSGWVNRSYTLPTSGITIIRVDDDL